MRVITRFSGSSLLLVSLATGGCSSSKSTDANAAPSQTSDGGGGNVGVGSDSLTLAPPEHGFQLKTIGTEIQPSEDTEYCEVVAVPGDPSTTYYVSQLDIEMVKHSHHLIVSTLDESLPKYADLNVGDITRCLGAQQIVGLAGATMVAGSQKPSYQVTYPKGVGLEFHGGQKLIFDYHYYNTETDPIHTGHRMNFHTVDSVEHVGQTMAFYNFTIDTPPGEAKSFLGECRFSDDVMVGGLTRHTHQWGKDFTVWQSGGQDDGRKIWTSKDYEGETEFAFSPPVLMKKDSGFRFECDFQNDTSSDLRFGVKATDEMCILFGLFWEPGSTKVKSQVCAMNSIDPDGVARGRGFSLPAGAADAGIPSTK
jgi:hypothetical protein